MPLEFIFATLTPAVIAEIRTQAVTRHSSVYTKSTKSNHVGWALVFEGQCAKTLGIHYVN